ncbi:hypothetical protein DPX16_1757 [Anabarilius grahami]|uniref:TERF1-interacting nuclear factor 2 N-terminal domain-containing protein n=1 Tax=Anabarilius grahami TaxID=495550 RepID=A0A3N0YA46_ANAGA|nr:hypothetical protein DPX16_1757 [Anabarilius grahami]
MDEENCAEITNTGVRLPLASLRLLVPPLHLMSAFMWQVLQQRSVMHYGRLEEFVSMVTETLPQLLGYRRRSQLMLGLRARAPDADLRTCVVNFKALVLALLKDPVEKAYFFQELMWDLLSGLEKLLPVPHFKQVQEHVHMIITKQASHPLKAVDSDWPSVFWTGFSLPYIRVKRFANKNKC